MGFLTFLGLQKVAEETVNVLEFPKVKPKIVAPVEPPKELPQEHYRVGFNSEGSTTLTLLSNNGYGSMTLTMNRSACEHLIRMLRSTYEPDFTDPTTDPDGGLPLPEETKKVA